MSIELSPDQRTAHDAVMDWSKLRSPETKTLAGFAGCGKTPTAAAIARTMKAENKRLRIGHSCFTGKASLVLGGKLKAAGVLAEEDYCGTLHRLIYEPIVDKKTGRITGWKKKDRDDLPFDIFFLDEASMISEDYYDDLRSYGKPILAVGDHGQLPPIHGKFNLMESPKLRLEKIHRQAEGSPIIRMSMLARLEGHIPFGNYGPGVFKTKSRNLINQIKDPREGVVLCGTNRTRTEINSKMRAILGRRGAPVVGETVICLKNDHGAGVYNGMIGELVSIDDWCPYAGKVDITGRLLCPRGCDYHYAGEVRFEKDDVTWQGPMLKEQFGAPKTFQEHPTLHYSRIHGLFDFGYCTTVHKAQGSERDNVVLVEETGWMEEDLRRRWLYTGVTRAAKKLAMVA